MSDPFKIPAPFDWPWVPETRLVTLADRLEEQQCAAEVMGEPWPRDAMEAAGYEYEIAHWPYA